jgi:hypothetical protein
MSTIANFEILRIAGYFQGDFHRSSFDFDNPSIFARFRKKPVKRVKTGFFHGFFPALGTL